MIRRHHRNRILKAVLFLLVPFVFLLTTSSCGIPTYLSIDTSEIVINGVTTDLSKIEVNVQLTDGAIAHLIERNATPSIKLFYVISEYPHSTDVSAEGSALLVLNRARNGFSSLYGGTSGNGYLWTPHIDGTGFYVYTKLENSSATYSKTKPGYEDDISYDAFLVGTFSHADSIGGDLRFAVAPDMDIPIPVGEFTEVVSNPIWNSIEFLLSLDAVNDVYSTITLTHPDSTVTYLSNYKKEHFFGENATQTQLQSRYSGYDPVTYELLINSIRSSDSTPLYLHVFAALYGGDGDFTNIFWSPLYGTSSAVGTIRLR